MNEEKLILPRIREAIFVYRKENSNKYPQFLVLSKDVFVKFVDELGLTGNQDALMKGRYADVLISILYNNEIEDYLKVA